MNLETAQTRLKALLRDNLYTRQTLTKSGMLAPHRLAYAPTSTRIFTKPADTGGEQYNVTILVDCSGSMWNSWHSNAGKATGEALEHIIRLLLPCTQKLEVIGYNLWEYSINPRTYTASMMDLDTCGLNSCFDVEMGMFTDGKNTGIYPIKQHPHQSVKKDDQPSIAGNADIQLLGKHVKRIAHRPGENIIVHLSDGEPHIDNWDNLREARHAILYGEQNAEYVDNGMYTHVQNLTKKHRVTLWHYGIGCRVSDTYNGNGKDCLRPDDIYHTIVEDIDKLINAPHVPA